MTEQTRAQLYTFFQVGDRPTQSQFADLIDSSLNLADSSAQTITSDVSCLGSLSVNGTFTINNTSTTTGNSNVSGNLLVAGNSQLSGNLNVLASANSSLTGNLIVTGPTTLSGGIVGVTDGSNATAGNVGQIISTDTNSGAAVALTSSVVANIATVSLSAGDWELFFAAQFTGDVATIVQNMTASISTTSATLNVTDTAFAEMPGYNLASFSFATVNSVLVGPFRQNITGTTTVYGVATATFGVNTCSAYGALVARRLSR